MKAIAPTAHRVLDYATVVLFAAAPTVFGLTGGAAKLSYALAIVHVLMTLLTHFRDGDRKLVPFRVHMVVEILVGVALIFVGVYVFPAALTFFCAVGALILLVVLVSFGGGAQTEKV